MKNIIERFGIVGQLFKFLWKGKSWWLLPVVAVLIFFSIFIILTGGSAITPFIYALF